MQFPAGTWYSVTMKLSPFLRVFSSVYVRFNMMVSLTEIVKEIFIVSVLHIFKTWWMVQSFPLNLKQPAFTYSNACKKTDLEINFMYLGNRVIYYIFKACCIICLLSTKWCSCHNFIFFYSNIKFLINQTLKFKYQPHHWKFNHWHSVRESTETLQGWICNDQSKWSLIFSDL